jgi:hypothetical protein
VLLSGGDLCEDDGGGGVLVGGADDGAPRDAALTVPHLFKESLRVELPFGRRRTHALEAIGNVMLKGNE